MVAGSGERRLGGAKGSRHMTVGERHELEALRRSGMATGAIAQQLERHPATIYRGLERNGGADGYEAGAAHRRARERRR